MSVETIPKHLADLSPDQQREAEQLAAYVHRSLPDGRRYLMPGFGSECLKDQLSADDERRAVLIAACVLTGAGVKCGALGCGKIFNTDEL